MNDTIDTILTDILHVLMLAVVVFGFLGNFLSFRIYSSSSLRKHPISIFFRTIAVFDSIMLVNGFSFLLYKKYDFSFNRLSDFICKFKNYFFYACGPISPWIMVVISIDRLISIMFPKRFPILFKSQFQICVILAVTIYNYLVYSFMVWNSVLVKSKFILFSNLTQPKATHFESKCWVWCPGIFLYGHEISVVVVAM